MSGATSSVECMGLLAIFLVAMMVWPADAAIGYDCNTKLNNTAVSFASVMSESEIPQSKSFGTSYPDEFACQFMGAPGYTAIVEEDKFYIIQCKPVIVIMQPQDKCYSRLPILRDGQKQFLTPWTLIITNRASEIPCDAPILQDYEMEATTYKVMPRPANPLEPVRLKPKIQLTWKYQNLENLANGGIYNEKDLGDMMDRLNHPEQFNPPPPIVDIFPDANENTYGVIYEGRDPHHVPANPLEPVRLKPKIQLTWKYQNLENLANGGIYNEKDLGDMMDRLNHPEQFNPPPPIVDIFPDANGNTYGVIYEGRDPHHVPWYKTLNTYSMLAIAAIALIGILVIAFIVKLVVDKVNHGSAFHSVNGAYMSLFCNRQRRRHTEANQADLKIRLNKTPDV